MIYPDFDNHPDEQLIFGIEQSSMNFETFLYHIPILLFRFSLVISMRYAAN